MITTSLLTLLSLPLAVFQGHLPPFPSQLSAEVAPPPVMAASLCLWAALLQPILAHLPFLLCSAALASSFPALSLLPPFPLLLVMAVLISGSLAIVWATNLLFWRIRLPAVLQILLENIPMRKAFLLQPSKAMQARMDTAHVPSATALARQCLLGKKLHHASQRRPHLQLLPPTQLHTCTASVMRWPPFLSAVPFLATTAAS